MLYVTSYNICLYDVTQTQNKKTHKMYYKASQTNKMSSLKQSQKKKGDCIISWSCNNSKFRSGVFLAHYDAVFEKF